MSRIDEIHRRDRQKEEDWIGRKVNIVKSCWL